MSKNHHLLKRKHWIFDLDGTLTIAVHDFNAIRKELGIPEGQPIIKTLESLPVKESRKQKKKLHEIEEKLALNASPAPGVKRLLETLSSQNYFCLCPEVIIVPATTRFFFVHKIYFG